MRFAHLAVLLTLAFVTSSCVSAGRQAFQAGQQAEAAQKIEVAFDRYREAAREDPNQPQYQQALENTRTLLAHRLSTEAAGHEAREDWATAASTWARAVDVEPDNDDFAIRRDLSSLKAKNLGPLDWYRGVAEVETRHPGHPIVRRTAQRAKERALETQTTIAEGKLEAGNPKEAVAALEVALSVDTKGVNQKLLARARAALLVQEADRAMAEDDPFAAYERYERAQGLHPSPEIARKLSTAKRRAAPIVKKMDRAYALMARGRHNKALALYLSVRAMKGAPKTIDAEIVEVRKALIAAECKKATTHAERGRLTNARRAIHRALDAANLDASVRNENKRAATEVASSALASGLARLEKSTLPNGGPLRRALEKLALEAVRKRVSRAAGIALRNPTKALSMIAGLERYADTLPQIRQLGRSLTIDAFTGTLERALSSARSGNDRDAADKLRQALAMSEAPPALGEPIKEACRLVADSRHLEASMAFKKALSAAPGSRLATWGLKITDLRRKTTEGQAVDNLARGRDEEASLALLESVASFEADNKHVNDGRDALLARAKKEAGRGDDAAATDLLRMAGRLTRLEPGARVSFGRAIDAFGNGDHREAKAGFDEAAQSAGQAKVIGVGRSLAEQRVNEASTQAEQKAAAYSELLQAAKDRSAAQDLRGAQRALKSAVAKSVALGPFSRTILNGINQITRGDPAKGYKSIEGSGIDRRDPLVGASRTYAIAMTKQLVERARRLMSKRPERAVVILEALEPFEKDVPEIRQIEQAIQVDAFVARLDEAERYAKRGKMKRASAVLMDALQKSNAPPKLEGPAKRGIEQLGAGQFLAAERAFAEAEAAAPKSRLAVRARAIARTRRQLEEKRARDALESERGDAGPAVEILEASLGIDPGSENVKAGATALLKRAVDMADDGEDEALASLLGYAARLAPSPAARSKIEDGVSKLATHNHAGAEAAFRAARVRAPTDRIAMLGQQIAKTRLLASFESGRVDVTELDEATAQSLAALRRDEPNRPEPAAALAELLETARSNSDAGRTSEATRLLSLAVIVASTPTSTRKAIDAARNALDKGQPMTAVKALSRLDAKNDELVRTAIAITERARTSRLIAALLDGRDKRAHAALATRLSEADGEKIRKAILDAADNEAQSGRDPGASRLLEALNRLEPKSDARVATKAANELFAKSSYEAAEAEYKKAQRLGESSVAKFGERLSFNRRVAAMFIGVAKFEKLEDLPNSAEAAKELISIDPYDKDGIRALEAVLAHAIERAKAGDQKGALGALRATVTAVDGRSELGPGCDHLADGQTTEAEKFFREAEKTLVPEEGETDGGLKKVLAHQRTVAARGRQIAKLFGSR